MIYVLSRNAFFAFCLRKGFTDDNVKYFPFALIRISTPSHRTDQRYFENDHINVLNLCFHDSIKQENDDHGNPVKLFSEEDANKVINFADANDDKTFVIHCDMGVSRSGAVGAFLRQMLNIDYDSFIKANPQIVPNILVSKILNDTYIKRLYSN